MLALALEDDPRAVLAGFVAGTGFGVDEDFLFDWGSGEHTTFEVRAGEDIRKARNTYASCVERYICPGSW